MSKSNNESKMGDFSTNQKASDSEFGKVDSNLGAEKNFEKMFN